MCFTDINLEKKVLREKYLKIRKNKDIITKKKHDQLIMNRLFSLDEYKQSNIVFLYMSKLDEVNTYEIFEKALHDKKTVAVPRCIKEKNELEFFKVNSMGDLKEGCFKVMEPITLKCLPISNFENGLCIVPGLSFDVLGYRLGYGGGYYDRFLSKFKGKTVGLCYEDFIVPRLPRDKFDMSVNAVITENRIIV